MKNRSSLLVGAAVLALSAASFQVADAQAGQTPSNEELYQMLLELKAENKRLAKELESAKVASRKAEKTATTQTVRNTQGASTTTTTSNGLTVSTSQSTATYNQSTPQIASLETASDQGADLTPVESSGPAWSFAGGVDVLFLNMYANQGAGGNSGAGNNDDYFPDFGTQVSPRYWLEVTSGYGFGLRGRYFSYDASKEYFGTVRRTDIEMIDIDLTYNTELMDTQIKPFVGARIGSVDLNGSDFGGSDPYHFDGAGITVGVDIKQPLADLPIALYAGGRYSALYGSTSFEPVSAAVLDNTMLHTVELRAGVEWRTALSSMELALQAGWEHQFYMTDTYLPFAIDPETLGDVSLGGPSISASLKF